MTHPRTLVIRADASPDVGMGHVMRCVALAQAWQKGAGSAVLVSTMLPEKLKAFVQNQNIEIRSLTVSRGSEDDAIETGRICARFDRPQLVLDGYAFAQDHWCALADRLPAPVLVIDDDGTHQNFGHALILNQNMHASPAMYPALPATSRLLLGPDFVLLRREITGCRDRGRSFDRADATRVLVASGGADPHGLLPIAIGALSAPRLAALETTVLVGPANPRKSALEREVSRSAGRMKLVFDAQDVGALIRENDIAVTAGGTFVYELAFFATPMVLVAAAQVEELPGLAMAKAGACVFLGPLAEVNSERIGNAVELLRSNRSRRRELGEKAARLVDGGGADRVIEALSAFARGQKPASQAGGTIPAQGQAD
jgi:UDP-2,4-diacetamido-2,4,6-trideoxy-beta-L-altropyranose hydrolase